MKLVITIILLIVWLFPLSQIQAVHYAAGVSGKILLQVEENGEAWYVFPVDGERYYLGRPSDAFEIMRKLSLGAKHDFIISTEIFPQRLSGRILLDVEANGEAYYIFPEDLKKYYLARPADAFRIMRELGLGITNKDLAEIPLGDVDASVVEAPKQGMIDNKVPFSSQAPFGNWADPRQQDACEEVTALMAVKWARGESFTKEEALKNILDASDYELKKYGEFRDISPEDAVKWIYNDYFNFRNASIKKDITINDIINELDKGNIVITPHNGQLLHNPYFTLPGPTRHMLVIRGFDAEKQEFITNDPGTRHGEAYRYDMEILFAAIRDYPTGYHEDIGSIDKTMIIVSK